MALQTVKQSLESMAEYTAFESVMLNDIEESNSITSRLILRPSLTRTQPDVLWDFDIFFKNSSILKLNSKNIKNPSFDVLVSCFHTDSLFELHQPKGSC